MTKVEELTEEIENLKIDEKVYGYEKAKFNGFGNYGKYDMKIKDRMNELMEMLKKEYPAMDNYLLWLSCLDYIIRDELKEDVNENEALEFYENYKKEKETLIYNNVKVEEI